MRRANRFVEEQIGLRSESAERCVSTRAQDMSNEKHNSTRRDGGNFFAYEWYYLGKYYGTKLTYYCLYVDLVHTMFSYGDYNRSLFP